MYRTDKANRLFGLAVTTALAGALLAGCAQQSGTIADASGAAVHETKAQSQQDVAVHQAEAAVLAEPRNAAQRLTLANAYLQAGRFASAETSFFDAMELGENSPRTALSLALVQAAQAKYENAAAILNRWEQKIAPSDLGLALALSGQPDRAVHVLTNAIRGGDATAKTRQNLAYSYALAGRWREARLTAAQDVPADQLGSRMEAWAQLNDPRAYQLRVAQLLGVPAHLQDAGQPAQLALANHPAIEAAPQLAALEAPKAAPVTAQPIAPVRASTPATSELPALAVVGTPPSSAKPVESVRRPAPVAAVANIAPVARNVAPRPVVAAAPAAQVARVDTPAPVRAATRASSAPAANTHLVQLGSFTSEDSARRAWSIYTARYPQLADHQMVITKAVVRGKNYWRVSAGGFDHAQSRAMCSSVRAKGGDGCISWAANSPLPGAVDTGVRMASR